LNHFTIPVAISISSLVKQGPPLRVLGKIPFDQVHKSIFLILPSSGKTVLTPETVHLIAYAEMCRRKTIEIPLIGLKGFEQPYFYRIAEIDAMRIGNGAELSEIHDGSPYQIGCAESVPGNVDISCLGHPGNNRNDPVSSRTDR
jgi:hypothetical protein